MGLLAFTIKPNIPAKLKPLEELAHNLWISWNFEAIMLFMRLDYDAWLASRQSPVRMLGLVSQEKLELAAADDSFLAALDAVWAKFTRYLGAERWYKGAAEDAIAYFSMEYGLDVALPVYSGGLGMLSGDHMKTSSDLGLPLVGVGLLYRQGYFQQYLNMDGFQQESYPENDWYNMPVTLCRDAKGAPISVQVELGPAVATAWIWKVSGRQEPALPAGHEHRGQSPAAASRHRVSVRRGPRNAHPAGDPARYRRHPGPGRARDQSSLHAHERGPLRVPRHRKNPPAHAERASSPSRRRGSPSGPPTSSRPILPYPRATSASPPTSWRSTSASIARELGLSWKEFLGLGREDPNNDGEEFCLTVLALRLSAYNNGVSRLHGEVSRQMWHRIWPSLPLEEIPIAHITNGVHPRSWITHDMIDLLDRYFGPEFHDTPTNLEIWDRIDRVSDEELWRTHERRRERMVAFARMRLQQQLERRGVTNSELSRSANALSPYALTISFARRFAAYKRADLLLSDPDRLIKLLTNNERPIQMIFAGKAHPHDLAGKEIIKKIVHFTSDPRVASRIVFLEDYDMTMSRYLVSGSDLWLNTPRRPLEASGTSGMKAAMNGTLNLSILDGWWDEAYSTHIGWAVGQGGGVRGPRPAGRGGGRGAVRPAGAGDHSSVLHPGHGRPAARLDPEDEGVDAGGGQAVQQPPDASGIRGELLHPRAGQCAQIRAEGLRALPGSRRLPRKAEKGLGFTPHRRAQLDLRIPS